MAKRQQFVRYNVRNVANGGNGNWGDFSAKTPEAACAMALRSANQYSATFKHSALNMRNVKLEAKPICK
jgi:hypothetical protein